LFKSISFKNCDSKSNVFNYTLYDSDFKSTIAIENVLGHTRLTPQFEQDVLAVAIEYKSRNLNYIKNTALAFLYVKNYYILESFYLENLIAFDTNHYKIIDNYQELSSFIDLCKLYV